MSEASPEDPFLRVLARHWSDVLSRADDDQRRRLSAILEQAAQGLDPREVKIELENEMFGLLPPDHPVIEVMSSTVMAVTGDISEAVLDASVQQLISIVGPLSAHWPPDRPAVLPSGDEWPGAVGAIEPWSRSEDDEQIGGGSADDAGADGWEDDEFDAQVQARLLELPMVRLREANAVGVDAQQSGLIRLTDPHEEVWLPRFQFDDTGQPRAVILEVNEMLGAAQDPWGATCWWVDPHARLEAVPRDLLGRDDELLKLAALTLVED